MICRTIAITGGSGYLGTRIACHLLNNGYDVIILSRKINRDLPVLLQNNILEVDYGSKQSLVSALKSVDCIIHLMSLNEIEAKDRPEEAAFVNVYLTEMVLQAAIQAEVKRFFYFSTVHVYGSPLEGVIDENHFTKPVHPYSVVHKAAEEFVLEKIRTRKIEGIIFRLSNGFGYPVYKDINRWTLLVNDICRQAIEEESIVIKTKNQKRDFITITDIENAISWFINRELSEDCIYNLSSGIAMTVGEMAEIVIESYFEISGKNISVKYEDVSENSLILKISNDKLFNTGFVLENNYKDEITETLKKCNEWFIC